MRRFGLLLLAVVASCVIEPNPTPLGGGAADEPGAQNEKPATSDAVAHDAAAGADIVEAPDLPAAHDAGPGEDAAAGPDDTGPPTPLEATEYCELAVDVFCPFYLRCGRMAVPDEATCQSVFVEVCNAKYEATYVLLADLGLLALSADGLTTCAGHLATAACEDQVFDLDGPCAAVWQGLQPDGGACGPGIESFVCGEASHCVLGLDLCGTCEAGAPTFPKSGDAWVGPGETCDADHKCQYKSVCADGVCRETALLGEPCGGGGESGSGSGASCASGVCEDGTCVVDPNPPSLYCLSP